MKKKIITWKEIKVLKVKLKDAKGDIQVCTHTSWENQIQIPTFLIWKRNINTRNNWA